MKQKILLLTFFIIPLLFLNISELQYEEEKLAQNISPEEKPSSTIIFRGDSNERLSQALKDNKVDLVSRGECPKEFHGCCLPNGISSYYYGVNAEFYNLGSPLKNDNYCDMWLHYKSDDGNVVGLPLGYDSKSNMLKAYGIYFECIVEDNKLWVPNLNYYHKGWPSETFDYVMDFSPSKFIRFKQQFCKSLAVPSTFKTQSGKLFPIEISENSTIKTFTEKPFDDLILEYKDIATGMENFADYYYFDRLDYIKDYLANIAFLVRDNETHFPVEGALVTITPLDGSELGVEAFERFTDFALRAPNFDYGFYGFKNCATEKTLDKFSMQSKLFTYFTEYGINPWALINSELKTKTTRDGDIYWITNDLLKTNPDLYTSMIETPIFKKEIFAKGHFFGVERYKRYKITIIHPQYQFFEREFKVNDDSQILIELAQITTKMEGVKGKGNYENMVIREIKLK